MDSAAMSSTGSQIVHRVLTSPVPIASAPKVGTRTTRVPTTK